ncbi:hypothetical protein [Nocardia brevicatena]|uniref:hypothetical protein n=1 Tax=Nocardia brevicatena TaxID=37327 RepID=UPI0002D4388F|nr:hypothetical protein [Nocardia brevicatena]
MAAPPEPTKTSLRQRLAAHAADRRPQLARLHVRYHGAFAYVTGELGNGTRMPLMRLRYTGYATTWRFAIYLAGRDTYHDSVLPSGLPAGTSAEALDCASASTSTTHRLATPDELTGAPTSRTLSGREGVVAEGQVPIRMASARWISRRMP